MKRQFILLISIHGKQKEFPFDIEDDTIPVYDAFLTKRKEIEETGVDIDLYTVFNVKKEQLFTEEIEDQSDVFICRWCGTLIESEAGVFVEDGASECHCEKCHPILYPDEETWNVLYNEYNVDEDTGEERNNFGGEFYYWTTAP